MSWWSWRIPVTAHSSIAADFLQAGSSHPHHNFFSVPFVCVAIPKPAILEGVRTPGDGCR
jgi:hypothetical protein